MSNIVYAQQNIVPNGDFETYSTCPTNGNQITTCIGWRNWTNGTSDYFNTCSSGWGSGVPSHQQGAGYQSPVSGNAYAGIINLPPMSSYTREYITRNISPMQVGATYEVSLSVNCANWNGFVSDNIGVFFYDAGPTFIPTYYTVPVSPQVDFTGNGVFADTLNWVRLVKTFTADSAYDNLVIGGFKDTGIAVETRSNSITSYYYIDSVVVRWVGKSEIYYTDSLLYCAGDSIRVPYTVNDPVFFNTNNVFSLQLSNASGSFSSPVTIGTKNSNMSDTIIGIIPGGTPTGTGYRIRMVASNNADTTENNGSNIKITNASGVSTTTNSPVCAGDTLDINITSMTGAIYDWTGPNSYTSTNAGNSFINAVPSHSGDYYINMQFYGCTVIDTVTVLVKPIPAKPVASSNTPICAGNSLQLTVGSVSGVTYSWIGPASFTSTTQNPTVNNTTTSMSGDYINAINLNGCIAKDTITVLVQPLPTAVTLSSNSPLCAGDTLKVFSSASSTGVTYGWTGPGSYTANTQNSNIPNSTSTITGWYKMTVNLNGCNYADSTYALINSNPVTPNISFNSPLCVGEALNLHAGTVSGATYNWRGANNFTSNQQNPVRSNMQYGDTGTYKVTTTANGCTSAQGSVKVNLNANPFVVILSTPVDSICQGDPVVFTALPNNHGGTPNYKWKVNAQNAGTGAVFNSSTLNDGDVISCEMTENTKCSTPYTDASNDIDMTVLPWVAPTVSITADAAPSLYPNEPINFTATATDAGAAPTYQWKRNGVAVGGATGAVWGANANFLSDGDDICVLVKSNYACPSPDTALSNCIKLEIRLGVDDIVHDKKFDIYPNPVKAALYLSAKERGLSYVVELYDVLGRRVLRQELNAQGMSGANNPPLTPPKRGSVDVSSLVPGVYVVKVNGVYVDRVVKE